MSKPATFGVSPWRTGWILAPKSLNWPATAGVAQRVRSGSLKRAARTASASRWSGCSRVTSTAVASLRAAGASVKMPGSMTRAAPLFSSRTHEWPSLVNCMAILQLDGEVPEFSGVSRGARWCLPYRRSLGLRLPVGRAGHCGPDPVHDLVGFGLGDLDELVHQVAALGGDEQPAALPDEVPGKCFIEPAAVLDVGAPEHPRRPVTAAQFIHGRVVGDLIWHMGLSPGSRECRRRLAEPAPRR